MLRGPNVDLLREVCRRTQRPVIASGGVSSLADLEALRALVPEGVEGAIVGKALYAGAFTLPQALDAAGRAGSSLAQGATRAASRGAGARSHPSPSPGTTAAPPPRWPQLWPEATNTSWPRRWPRPA